MGLSTNLNLRLRFRCRFRRALLHLLRQCEERLCSHRVLAGQRHRMPRIAALADVRIKFHFAEEVQSELAGSALASSMRKDVDLMLAMRTTEAAHILDQTKDVH